MAINKGNYSHSEVEYIVRSRNEGKSFSQIAKGINRSPQGVYQKYKKANKPSVIEVDTKELNSVTMVVKGIEITMVFK
jgi:hypothetical protein